MLIELVDVLRCPRPHDETWLVASADRTEGRRIIDGTLGCPICQTEYPIRRGVADFSGGAALRASREHASSEKALRIAALLDLTPGPGFAILFGAWGSYAADIAAITPVPLLLVNPAEGIESTPGVSIILASEALPLAPGRSRAAAIDPALSIPVNAAVGAVRARGRIVSPASTPIVPGAREIARDAEAWVGEREAQPSAPITLSARPRQA